MAPGEMRVLREARLRILNSLPRRHKDYFFEEVRKLCATYIASLGLPLSDRKSETLELLSEVMAKLLGVASLSPDTEGDANESFIDEEEVEAKERHAGETVGTSFELPRNWDEADPKRDERVTWLIEQIGGPRALAHRYEDMRRLRWGRWRPSGYRNVQISALDKDMGAGTECEEETLGRYADRSYPSHRTTPAKSNARGMVFSLSPHGNSSPTMTSPCCFDCWRRTPTCRLALAPDGRSGRSSKR